MQDDLLGLLLSMEREDDIVREDYVRAPFGYPGGKARSIPHILPALPYTSMYCEPFGGSGAVWLARHPSKLEIFNDRYSGVTSFFRAVRDHKKELVERLSHLIHSREEFIWCKNTWKNHDDLVERAARWYYCVRASFGAQSMYFGRSRNPKASFASKLSENLDHYHDLHDRIKNTQIENLSWQSCFDDYNHDDCVWYLDPPYYKVSKGMYEHDMPDSEHVEILERIQRLTGFVAISSYPNDLYNSYPWSRILTWEQPNNTLGIGTTMSDDDNNARGVVREVLYIK